ncbi:MAG: HlyD family secretion protein [Bacteroidales bacterium]|nr:HlyD family secretion protein [Bacteroidales bacterium]
MSQKNIFPAEIIEFSKEYHQTVNTVKTQIIYTVIVLSVISALISLPFIYVDVTIQADGLIRPVNEKTEVKSMQSGIVKNIFIKEGQIIKKEDTILSIINDDITGKIELVKYQIKQDSDFIKDIKELLRNRYSKKLKTAYYMQKNAEYNSQLSEINNEKIKARIDFNRNITLYSKGVISDQQFENLQLALKASKNKIRSFKESYKNILQADLVQKKDDIKKNISQLEQLKQQEKYFIIKSPVTGTAEQFTGIYTGTNIQSGQTIIIISPQSELTAEIYVTPKDIGYIKKGSKANIQITAFNYNDWGMLKAEVKEISNDFISINNRPIFRVRCKLEKTYLQLKSGFKGRIKKGMTVRARFIITKRSLWQLLFDNVNDWMNPAMNKIKN